MSLHVLHNLSASLFQMFTSPTLHGRNGTVNVGLITSDMIAAKSFDLCDALLLMPVIPTLEDYMHSQNYKIRCTAKDL